MKKRILHIAVYGVVVAVVVLVQRDLSIRRAARASMLDIATSYESLDKLDAETAAERFERAKGMLFFGDALETQAADLTRMFLFSYVIKRDSVAHAKEQALDATTESGRRAWEDISEEKEAELAGLRRQLADGMRVLLAAAR